MSTMAEILTYSTIYHIIIYNECKYTISGENIDVSMNELTLYAKKYNDQLNDHNRRIINL